ncbi:MAG: DUF503 domain-containing protein [Anaerolineae bacterium]|nr:DUF503 domain-containing protein [Anaerolineae bacterium]
MVIGACTIKLYMPTTHSLKEKRSVVKSVTARVSREFNVSIAEVDYQDVWQTALLGIATVSNDVAYAHGVLERVVQWIESNRPDVEVLEVAVEML